MIAAPHMLVGAAIGNSIKNYYFAGILAFISHFILDAIPHWGYIDDLTQVKKRDFKLAAIDFAIGIILILVLFFGELKINFMLILIGIFGSLLPDFLLVLLSFFPESKFLSKFDLIHDRFHKKSLNKFTGITTQILTILLTLLTI